MNRHTVKLLDVCPEYRRACIAYRDNPTEANLRAAIDVAMRYLRLVRADGAQ